MKLLKILVVVDMQNDFIDGSLGTPEAKDIVGNVCNKIEGFNGLIYATKDIHDEGYLDTLEGKHLPVEHCIRGTEGIEICGCVFEHLCKVNNDNVQVVRKHTFASTSLVKSIKKDEKYAKKLGMDIEIELIGLCTDICVISNALLLKAYFPETKITVDASCCAGSTPEKHKMALEVMKSCHIDVINE